MPTAKEPKIREIGAGELAAELAGATPPVVVDVLPEDAHAEIRIPGSRNACVFEVTFLARMKEMVPDLATPLVVYGSGPDCLDAPDAADRLLRAGYGDVRAFRGGRTAWLEAGQPVEGRATGWDPAPHLPLPDGALPVDTEASVVEWTGRNLGSRHHGTIRFCDGTVEVEGGEVRRVELVADLATIAVADLKGDLADLLESHLRSEDFFAVARFPTARIRLDSIVRRPETPPGRPDHECEGHLRIRDRERGIALRAQIGRKGDGIALQAGLTIDRTLFGATYGSGRFYHRLGMHLVNDEVDLAVRVIARSEERSGAYQTLPAPGV